MKYSINPNIIIKEKDDGMEIKLEKQELFIDENSSFLFKELVKHNSLKSLASSLKGSFNKKEIKEFILSLSIFGVVYIDQEYNESNDKLIFAWEDEFGSVKRFINSKRNKSIKSVFSNNKLTLSSIRENTINGKVGWFIYVHNKEIAMVLQVKEFLKTKNNVMVLDALYYSKDSLKMFHHAATSLIKMTTNKNAIMLSLSNEDYLNNKGFVNDYFTKIGTIKNGYNNNDYNLYVYYVKHN